MILRLIKEWKEKLDKEFFAVAVLIDLSKAFAFIPYNLLIAKLNTVLTENPTYAFIITYKYSITRIESTFQTLLSGVPKGWILGPLLFDGVWTIANEENCPQLGLGFGLGLGLELRVGGNFPRGQLS